MERTGGGHLTQLNYKHLQYFHVVAREGSVNAASKVLHLTPQTISGQISLLEASLGQQLFAKVGRNLRLTPCGQKAYRYTTDIFALGDELMQELSREDTDGLQQISVGVVDSIPKTIAYEILKPLLENPAIRLTCHEGDIERLMAELALQKLDIVLSDVPLNPAFSIKARTYLLGESSLSCFGVKELFSQYAKKFPESLNGAPVLLPRTSSHVGRELHKWLEQKQWSLNIRGQFDDSALIKVFGQAGEGLFFMPSDIEKLICAQFGVRVVGRINDIRERYYAIRPQNIHNNPELDLICENAKKAVFNK